MAQLPTRYRQFRREFPAISQAFDEVSFDRRSRTAGSETDTTGQARNGDRGWPRGRGSLPRPARARRLAQPATNFAKSACLP